MSMFEKKPKKKAPVEDPLDQFIPEEPAPRPTAPVRPTPIVLGEMKACHNCGTEHAEVCPTCGSVHS